MNLEEKIIDKGTRYSTECVGEDVNGDEKLEVIKEELYAFVAGAEYLSNVLWHKCDEAPKDGGVILLHMNSGICRVIKYTTDDVCIDGILWIKVSEQKEWAYIDDLLPHKFNV